MIKHTPFNCCLTFFLFSIVIILSSSCASRREKIYFNNLSDSIKFKAVAAVEFKEPIIQPDDILNISIETIDPQETLTLNQVNTVEAEGTLGNNSGGQQGIGYLVDKKGNVEIPLLGVIKIAGLTTEQARDTVRNVALRYNKQPTVQVRFSNFKITVLGEVSKPGSFIVPNEKISILDAIGMAGDLTIYGKRENVMLIRNSGAKKDVIRLDLTSSSLFQSPYFYLRQNDVIYVQMGKGRVAASNTASVQMLAIGATLLTLLVTILRK
ncbi:MAG TPA: polysaccharide biosynthesis/export family protein, partial [Bacteroidia bacterium]|jgi:polysaccharide export outer membrane protein|nr:polysaccharide biosynthesis/export family protein [Bacteroidia bacterium]